MDYIPLVQRHAEPDRKPGRVHVLILLQQEVEVIALAHRQKQHLVILKRAQVGNYLHYFLHYLFSQN